MWNRNEFSAIHEDRCKDSQSLKEILPLFTSIGKVDVQFPRDLVLESEGRIFSKALLRTWELRTDLSERRYSFEKERKRRRKRKEWKRRKKDYTHDFGNVGVQMGLNVERLCGLKCLQGLLSIHLFLALSSLSEK